MADKDTNPATAGELIKHCAKMFAEALHQFRECHDLTMGSGLFSKEEVLGVDTVAITFRDMGLKTITVAKATSTQWIESVILYYQSISSLDADGIKQMKELLISQAGDLSKAFDALSAWAQHLTNMFETSVKGTVKEKEEFLKRFHDALVAPTAAKEKAEEEAEKAKKAYDDAVKKNEHHVHIGHKVPKEVTEAKEAMEAAEKNLKDATEKLQTATKNDNKAKDVASKTSGLVESLTSLNTMCGTIATFWKMESKKFLSDNRSGKAIVVSQDDIAFWKAGKAEFNLFVDVMTPVANSFNFTTHAKLPKMTTMNLSSLGFELEVPTYLDVKK